MANVNPQLVPLNPSPLTNQQKYEDCLTPAEKCISEKFVRCVNSGNKGACCLTTALCCAIGGVSAGISGLFGGNVAMTAVGMAMQGCGIAFSSGIYGVGCGQVEMAKSKDEEIEKVNRGHMRRYQALNAQHQRLVLQQPPPQPPIAPDDGYNSGVDE